MECKISFNLFFPHETIMVNRGSCHLSLGAYKHYTSAYVKLERLRNLRTRTINICGIHINCKENIIFEKGNLSDEVAINGQVLRIKLVPNSLNLKITSEFTTRFPKRRRMYCNDSFNKSILKQNKENECNTPSKSVSFNNTFYITPISPRQHEKSPTPVKDYEFAYKEYLKSVQMNGACSTPDKEKVADSSNTVNNKNTEDLDEYTDVEYLEEPKKKRGRPKGSGKFKTNLSPPSTIFLSPSSSPKKRGWPLGLSRKAYMAMKSQKPGLRGRGRPRKIVAFGFQSIVSDIKTVALPSDLWSAHVSVTAKKSQVCFTRVLQTVLNTVPVECDRSVKFNGSVNYLVKINNRDVELLAAPSAVNSLRDVEILLEIVNEIGINDPVLEYHNR